MATSQGPLTELARRWRPIFAQPGRQYHHLTALRSFRRTRSGARFRVASDDGTTAHLTITFVQPEVIRVQLSLGERPPHAESVGRFRRVLVEPDSWH